MKKTGFTLIELLAVLVVLALLTTIAMPMVMNHIDKSKKNTFTSNMNLLIKAVDNYIVDTRDKDFLNGTKSLSIANLPIKNKEQYKSGTVSYKDDKIVLNNITNGSYCANGTSDNLTITKGSC